MFGNGRSCRAAAILPPGNSRRSWPMTCGRSSGWCGNAGKGREITAAPARLPGYSLLRAAHCADDRPPRAETVHRAGATPRARLAELGITPAAPSLRRRIETAARPMHIARRKEGTV